MIVLLRPYKVFNMKSRLLLSVALILPLAACAESEESQRALETSGPEVLVDAPGTGVEVVDRLVESSETVVVAGADEASQRQAAAHAVEIGAPMVVDDGSNSEEIDSLINDLGAEIVRADGAEELSWHEVAEAEGTGEMSLPPILVTEETSLAALTTAVTAGADVVVLEHPDPRISSESIEVVTGGDTIAIGEGFGDTEHYADLVDLAHNGELPGGGGLVFPGRRMIALYGHPSGDALGAMGEQPPAEAAQRAQQMAEEYQQFEEQPVIPAFEIIVTVASEFPGEDGKYSNIFPVEDYIEYVDAITEVGGYVVIDLQPGKASFLEQAQAYEELLKRPNVGLALDPEWKIGEDEVPLQRVGSVEAAEVNEVADWLAQFTRENNLPQKAFVLHQFQLQMLRDREQIDTSHPELAFVLHADGHGVPEQKFDTWNVLREGLSDDWFMAWKNFYDEDTPTFTPQETYENVEPRPWFVSYQ